jgi:hypothetical protein
LKDIANIDRTFQDVKRKRNVLANYIEKFSKLDVNNSKLFNYGWKLTL